MSVIPIETFPRTFQRNIPPLGSVMERYLRQRGDGKVIYRGEKGRKRHDLLKVDPGLSDNWANM